MSYKNDNILSNNEEMTPTSQRQRSLDTALLTNEKIIILSYKKKNNDIDIIKNKLKELKKKINFIDKYLVQNNNEIISFDSNKSFDKTIDNIDKAIDSIDMIMITNGEIGTPKEKKLFFEY